MSCNNNDNTQLNIEQVKYPSRQERGKIEAYLDMGCESEKLLESFIEVLQQYQLK